MIRVPVAGWPARRRQVLAAVAAVAAVAVAAVIAVILSAAGGGSQTPAAPRGIQAAGPAGGAGARAGGASASAGNASAHGKSASAPGSVPVVYAQVAGWHDGEVRPAAVYVGEGGAPYVSALNWSAWAAAGARASGFLHMQVPGCTMPTYRCRYLKVRVTVRLSEVRTHDGAAYFSRMRWTYFRDQRPHAISWRTDRGFWRG